MAPKGQSWRFDDIPLGYVHMFGASALSREDIALFHERFGPYLPQQSGAIEGQPAAQGHVFALWSRMVFEETKDWPILARLGQDALRWYRTAQAGDVLSVKLTFLTKEPVNDQRGIIIVNHDVLNQNGDLVMSLLTRSVYAR